MGARSQLDVVRDMLPPGYAVVPIKPTEKMLQAGCLAGPQHSFRYRQSLGEILTVEWQAMIEAAE